MPEVIAVIAKSTMTDQTNEDALTPAFILKIRSSRSLVSDQPAKHPTKEDRRKIQKYPLLINTRIWRGLAPTTFLKAISFIFFRAVNETRANRPVAVSRILIRPNQRKMGATLLVTR